MKELLTEFIKLITELISLFKKSGSAIKKTALMYDAMHSVLNRQTKIGSIMILCTHNGGKQIRTYSPTYVSCLHEDYIAPFKSVKSDYQKLSLDKPYWEFISKLIDDKDMVMKENELPEGSLLKTIYDAEQIAQSRVFFLKETRKYFFFITFRTHDKEKDLMEPETDLQIRIAVSKIKQLLN